MYLHLLAGRRSQGASDSRHRGTLAIPPPPRTARHRLIRHNNGKKEPAYELYDHSSPEKETKNIAGGNPDLVRELSAKLDAKLGK